MRRQRTASRGQSARESRDRSRAVDVIYEHTSAAASVNASVNVAHKVSAVSSSNKKMYLLLAFCARCQSFSWANEWVSEW